MSPEEIRLQALKLAVKKSSRNHNYLDSDDTLRMAKKFELFINGGYGR